jgi:hypothetical protein
MYDQKVEQTTTQNTYLEIAQKLLNCKSRSEKLSKFHGITKNVGLWQIENEFELKNLNF